jgi:lysophospholipase L1-like esterase
MGIHFTENEVQEYSQMSRLGRFSGGALSLLIVLVLCLPALGSRRTEWLKPEYPRRAVFSIPKDAGLYLLVDVPLGDKPEGEGSFECVSASGSSIPCRLVYSDGKKVSVLVCTGPGAKGSYYLYYGAPGSKGRQEIVDPVPVGVSVYRSTAKGIPNAWEKMRYMAGHSRVASKTLRQHYFGKIEGISAEQKAEQKYTSWKYPIVRLQSHVLCSKSGPYRFGINCSDAGFVLINGEVVASWPGEHAAGTWKSGPPVYLEAGIHKLSVYTKAKYTPYAALGWQPPGAEEKYSIPHKALVCASRVTDPRSEIRDEAVHPHFLSYPGRAYAFRNHRSVFIPVRFKSHSAYAKSSKLTYSWDFGDGHKAEGTYVDHVFSEARKHEVSLTVRDADGAENVCKKIVDYRMIQPQYYAVAAEVTGLPAVCYPKDPVAPILQAQWAAAYSSVSKKMPENIVLQLSWSVEGQEGAEDSGTRDLPMTNLSARVELASTNVSSMSRISWDISHQGISVASRIVNFVRPPFGDAVSRVSAEKLFNSGGERLILVPVLKSDELEQPAITTEQARGRIVCLDDSLAASGMDGDADGKVYYGALSEIMGGPDGPSIEHVQLTDWDDSTEAYGPLLRIREAAKAVAENADVVILSVGLQDIVHQRDPAEFERHAAALSDLIWGTLKCPVVWVTPPPYTATTTEVRPFAAAVQRVAQARNMPVADLYSAFMNAGDEKDALFRGKDEFSLSGQGHHLAARAIARALPRQEGRN